MEHPICPKCAVGNKLGVVRAKVAAGLDTPVGVFCVLCGAGMPGTAFHSHARGDGSTQSRAL
ncbi:MAG TPA: hypothetical protein VNF47_15350 [Streptosporangiaceae bacterium]|nr:hypothetical protein [Streptosporangiaceae bacterium]